MSIVLILKPKLRLCVNFVVGDSSDWFSFLFFFPHGSARVCKQKVCQEKQTIIPENRDIPKTERQVCWASFGDNISSQKGGCMHRPYKELLLEGER